MLDCMVTPSFPAYLKSHFLLTLDFFSRVCGVLTMNSVGVEFTTHLSDYLGSVHQVLDRWKPPSSANGAVSQHARDVQACLSPHLTKIVAASTRGNVEEKVTANDDKHIGTKVRGRGGLSLFMAHQIFSAFSSRHTWNGDTLQEGCHLHPRIQRDGPFRTDCMF